jgi:signal transduction histidine kinase
MSVIGRPHILIAEDSRPARQHLVQTLEALGDVLVSEAQNGAEAISKVERLSPDLLLCDYNMPILDGLQTLKLLRRRWSAVELPILMLTGSHSLNDKVAAFNFGANDYVTKPVHPEELLARVKAQLSLKLAIAQNQAARDRLLQASKLQTVGRLAAGLAHEMNTPAQYVSDNLHFLTKAFGGMQAVLESLQPIIMGEPPAPREETLGEARQLWRKQRVAFALEQAPAALSQSLEGVRRIADLIAELKAFTGTGAEEARAASNLNEAVSNVVNVTRAEWEPVAELVFELDGELPPVPVYVAELKQVLLNLVYNCVHAFRGEFGGEARRGNIRIGSRLEAAGAVLSISDDGPGIPAGIRDQIFDPFFTTKQVGGGTGQGLAVAYDVVVNRHGGKLTCLESAEHGARFEVWLPLALAGSDLAP